MADESFNVLFLGSDNSACSIMAEALLKRFGATKFSAFSAGLRLADNIHPLALELLKEHNVPCDGMAPKSMTEFFLPSAPQMDFVIALGKDAASAAKNWPGSAFKAQWGITDPSEQRDPSGHKLAFSRAFREIENRVKLFVLVRHEPVVRRSPAPTEQHA